MNNLPTDAPQAPIADREAAEKARSLYLNQEPREGRDTTAAVMTSFNKIKDVRLNLDAIRRQTIKFDEVIVVDNHSNDGTQEMIRGDFPEVHFIEMPNSSYGACETFNIGFGNATTKFVAILDDDIVMPEEWVEKMLAKFRTEPDTTGFISSRVVEPEMPDWYKEHPTVNTERYMSTFRGCATMARRDVLKSAGYYDVRFFIYGNERDLSCRILNLGFRILQYPTLVVQHGTPFGMKKGPRSLYYHVRNLWLYMFKNVGWGAIFGFVFSMATKPFRKKKNDGEITADAVGSIGGMSLISDTPGGLWICIKATLNAICLLPYCLKNRRVCTHEDSSLPTH
ncbi:MAG: GT2 family glycosyltransferase [Planctomycetota bacterium]|jgi:GT2 family glycosyltransferase